MKHRLGNRRMLSALCLVVTGALALGACGSGFEGDDECRGAVRGALHPDRLVRRRRDQGGPGRRRGVVGGERRQGRGHRRLRPRPAAQPGLRQQQPAGRLLRLDRPARRLRQQRLALRVRRRPVQRRRLPADPGRRVHRRRRVRLRAQGLLDARPGHQHRSSGRTPGSPTPTSPPPGRSSRPSPSKLTKGKQVGLAFGPEYAAGRRVLPAGRRRDDQRGRHRGHRRQPREPRGARPTSRA